MQAGAFEQVLIFHQWEVGLLAADASSLNELLGYDSLPRTTVCRLKLNGPLLLRGVVGSGLDSCG